MDIDPSARTWCIMYVHQSSCRKSGVVSRALKWLFCTAWHNSVEIAPPGQASLCIRKHLRLRGDASRKETRRTASSEQTVEVLEGLTTMMKKSMTMSMRVKLMMTEDFFLSTVHIVLMKILLISRVYGSNLKGER